MGKEERIQKYFQCGDRLLASVVVGVLMRIAERDVSVLAILVLALVYPVWLTRKWWPLLRWKFLAMACFDVVVAAALFATFLRDWPDSVLGWGFWLLSAVLGLVLTYGLLQACAMLYEREGFRRSSEALSLGYTLIRAVVSLLIYGVNTSLFAMLGSLSFVWMLVAGAGFFLSVIHERGFTGRVKLRFYLMAFFDFQVSDLSAWYAAHFWGLAGFTGPSLAAVLIPTMLLAVTVTIFISRATFERGSVRG